MDAAKEAGLSESYAQSLHAGTEKKYFKEELDRRREDQTERILVEEPDRSKKALLKRWDEFRDACKTRKGENGDDPDLTNWARSLIEEGKLMGHYVQKHEHSGKLTVADIIGSITEEEIYAEEYAELEDSYEGE